MEALDPRAIVLSLDDVLVNPVLVAGPEQHETKQTSLSAQEKFFVDVHNVFVEQQKQQQAVRKKATTSENNEAASTADEDLSSVASVTHQLRDGQPDIPLAEVEKFIHMARFQMDNLCMLVDTVLQRSELTIARTPTISRSNPSDIRTHIAARRQELNAVSNILSATASSVRQSSSISSSYSQELANLNSFWSIVRSRRESSLFLHCSFTAPRGEDTLVPLHRTADGTLSIRDPDNDDDDDERRQKHADSSHITKTALVIQHRNLYKQLFEKLSEPAELSKCHARSIGNRIVWEDREGQRFELRLERDQLMINALDNRAEEGGVPQSKLDDLISQSLSVHLLSRLVESCRTDMDEQLRRTCSSTSNSTAASDPTFSLSFVIEVLEHRRFSFKVFDILRRFVRKQRDGRVSNDVRLHSQFADSPVHAAFKIYFDNMFICEGNIGRSSVSMTCSGARNGTLPHFESYMVTCYAPDHVLRVVEFACDAARTR